MHIFHLDLLIHLPGHAQFALFAMCHQNIHIFCQVPAFEKSAFDSTSGLVSTFPILPVAPV